MSTAELRWVDQPKQVAAEFMRRLKHQLETYDNHDAVCAALEKKRMCRQHKLLVVGFKDSTTTLKQLGYAREAQDLVRAHEGRHDRDGRDK